MKTHRAFLILFLVTTLFVGCGKTAKTAAQQTQKENPKAYLTASGCADDFTEACNNLETSCWNHWRSFCDDYHADIPTFWPR